MIIYCIFTIKLYHERQLKSMTNEHLAQLIQNGRKDLIPELWNRVQKLLYMKSDKLYRLHRDNFDRCGVEAWDIKQASYFAFLDAVRAFKPDSGLKFVSYLNYPFKKTVNVLLGRRTSRTVNEPLNSFTSLDKLIATSEGDSCSLSEAIPDKTSLAFVEDIEKRSEAETLRSITEKLSEPYKSIIKARYFEGLTLQATAEKLSMSRDRVRHLEGRALRILRQSKSLKFFT